MTDQWQDISITPDTTLRQFVSIAANQLLFNDKDAFEFTIDGFGPAGPIEIHFEATMRRKGNPPRVTHHDR